MPRTQPIVPQSCYHFPLNINAVTAIPPGAHWGCEQTTFLTPARQQGDTNLRHSTGAPCTSDPPLVLAPPSQELPRLNPESVTQQLQHSSETKSSKNIESITKPKRRQATDAASSAPRIVAAAEVVMQQDGSGHQGSQHETSKVRLQHVCSSGFT